jgi:hypothetical protein
MIAVFPELDMTNWTSTLICVRSEIEGNTEFSDLSVFGCGWRLRKDVQQPLVIAASSFEPAL